MRKKRVITKVTAMLLSFAVVFSMLPGVVFAETDITSDKDAVNSVAMQAAGSEEGEGELQPSSENEKIAVTLYGHNAFFNHIELYKWSNDKTQGNDLLKDITKANDTYAFSVDAGDYFVKAYYKNNSDIEQYLGGIVLSVTEDGTHDFKLSAVTGIKAGNSGWVLDDDYTMDVKVVAQDSSEKKFEMGEITQWGSIVKSCIAFSGDTVTATFNPNAEKHPDFMAATASKTVNNGSSETSLSATCQQFVLMTFKAPKDSTISVGTLKSYYVYNFAEPYSTKNTETGVEARYKVSKNTDYFYRVQNPNGVTYWNYEKWNESGTVEITAGDLYISDSEFNKKTVFHNFEKNVYDRADIYLNINQAGYMNMRTGDTYELNSFRNWFAIESISNAKVALPDMHYEVIGLDGKASDVVSITPNEKNNNVAVMKANKSGTAIVMVTYDAMTHMQAMSAASKTGGENTKQFSAIWPECTGVFVVSVDADGTAIKTNMQMERFGKPSTFDAEHDILFYTGDEGASYSFTPEEGCIVSVARSKVSDKMSFDGFTTDKITTDNDGKVTISGLTTGRHIIKVDKDGKATYQVVTARGVSYKILDTDGKELGSDAKIKAGDTIKLQFTGLINPQEKLSGVYNFNARCYYQGNDGTFFESDPGTIWGAYDFSGKAERQLVTVKIPKYWAENSYTLSGSIKMTGWPGVPTHRMVTYAKGAQKGFDSPAASNILGQLPDVTIQLAETEFIDATLKFVDNEGKPVDRNKLTISLTDNDKNSIAVSGDGSFKCYKETYNYVINAAGYEYTEGSVTVSADDEVFTVTLNKTSENAWDGITKTEPEKDEAGVYQIATGAEMAWFAENASKNNAVKAILTADIDLGKYQWKAGNLSSGKCEFDGNSHKIFNLNASKGLFNTIGGGSVVKNLTVDGAVTASGGTAGGIAGYLQNGTIENCVNKTIINAKGTNIGGIAGYAYNGAVIKNCANMGIITGDAKQTGGILGNAISANVTVEGCINSGDVSGVSEIGGIAGKDGYGITVKDSYNTGKIAGTQNAGGIIGSAKNTKISSSYTTGVVTGGKAFAGSADGVKFEKCYYATGLAEDENAEALNEEELKSADLSEAFKLVCGAKAPKLKWEEGTEHQGIKKEEIAATCTAKGYTVYTCGNCNQGYRADYIAVLGHDFCKTATAEEAEKCSDCRYNAPTCTEAGSIVHICRREGCSAEKTDIVKATGHTSDVDKEKTCPAYKDCICCVCKAEYRHWNDERLQYMVFCNSGLSEVTMSNNGDYPWVWNAGKARFESSNTNKDKTTSETNIKFTLTEKRYLSFGYGASSENGYDKVTITLKKDSGDEKIADGISGTQTGTYSSELAAGTYTLNVKYVKDEASKSNDDLGYLSNIKITEKAENVPVTPSEPDEKPSVTFRLIGCEKATQDVDLGTNTYMPNYVTWIATTTYTLEELGANATIGTVFKKALDSKGLSYEGFDGNYISSITAPAGYKLAELTNGPKSGWMYTVNGTHPNKGLLDYEVKNGDAIIWHYVNDYAYEVQDWTVDEDHPALGNSSTWNRWLQAPDTTGSSGGGAAAGAVEEKDKNVITDVKAGTTTAPTDIKVSGSTAAATVSDENAKELLKQAKENKSSEIVINVSAADTKDAETVNLELDKKTVESIVKDTEATVTVKTPAGEINLDKETLKQIAGEAEGDTIVIEITKVLKPEESQKTLIGTNGNMYRLTVKSGNKVISDFNGTVTVRLAVPAPLKDKNIAAVHIEGSALEKLEGRRITQNKEEFYEFTTKHFSEFALIDTAEVKLDSDDKNDSADKAKSLIKELKLKAVSSKTAKKNVKVTVKMNSKNNTLIKELSDMGYTVKYRYYRSVKKASKYTAVKTKTSKTYINTKGKRGSKYYYKVRAVVYDGDKVIAQSALKQCKYAVRTWSK